MSKGWECPKCGSAHPIWVDTRPQYKPAQKMPKLDWKPGGEDADPPIEAIRKLQIENERMALALQKIAALVDSEADEPLDDAIRLSERALSPAND